MKKQLKLNKNHGRSYARSEGIKMASGEWILFLNSNIRVESNLILKYSESIWKNTAYAFGGCINYTSTDSIFEKYLNMKFLSFFPMISPGHIYQPIDVNDLCKFIKDIIKKNKSLKPF